MSKYLLCDCGQQTDTADKRPGDVVVCPGCGARMPIPGDSPEEFARQLMGTADRPGVFAHVQLNDNSGPPRKTASASQREPVGWFRRLLRRLGLG
jgi:hypothetical protein